MRVHKTNLGWGDTSVLQFHRRSLLASENNDILSLDSDGTCSYTGVIITAVIRLSRSLPLFTASSAYSTWKTWPSGLIDRKLELPQSSCSPLCVT